MRLFELLFLLVLLGATLLLFLKPSRRPRWTQGLALGAAAIGIAHVLLDGARWQLVPAYVLALGLAVWAVVTLRRRLDEPALRDRPLARLPLATFGLLMLIVAAVAAWVLPVFELPAPAGPYPVGTTTFQVIDSSRAEVITPIDNDLRTFMVRVWYPARAVEDAATLPYAHPGEAGAYAAKYGLPRFATSHLRLVDTEVVQDVPVAEGGSVRGFPVLLFSHGYNVPAFIYQSFLPTLASQGYVIFSVNHTYESTASVFPSGQVAAFDYAYAARTYTGAMWAQLDSLQRAYEQAATDSARVDVLRSITGVYPNSPMVERWADDLSTVLDVLVQFDGAAGGRFAGRLDLDRVGVFGHSAGGAAAGQLSATDARIDAGANWDGAQWGTVIDTTIAPPFLMIYADRPATSFNPNPLIYRNGSEEAFYAVTLRGTGHSSFSDVPYIVPLRRINQAGPIEPSRATAATLAFTQAFFDHYLRGEPLRLLNSPSAHAFPEARIEITPGDG